MIKTILLGCVVDWPTRESAERYFSAMLRETGRVIPDVPGVTDRIYQVLDNIRAGKDICTDFESAK